MTASICDIETLPDPDEGRTEKCPGRLVEEDYDLLYRTHARPLFRYLLRQTLGDYREAEDYLQETFLRTWRWLQEHTVDPKVMRPWLYTVARRIVIDGVRARRARPAEVSAADLSLLSKPDNDIERLVQVYALRSAMLSLSPDHRAALTELFYHERTAREAADILGIPEGTVKSRAHYALQALRQATRAEEREGNGVNPVQPALGNRPPARRAPSAQSAADDGPKATREGRYRPADSRPEASAAA
jgi:RNA polymerase sigma-70 factor (ECF subfamily)